MKDISISNKSENLRKNQRIAVIGASATWITIDRRLIELGYTEVTVLERENRVGGKCFTMEVELDNRFHDIGAGFWALYDSDQGDF